MVNVSSERISDAEWRYLLHVVGPMSERFRNTMDRAITGRDKAERKDARQRVMENLPRPSGLGTGGRTEPQTNPFFELQWYRAIRSKPSLEIDAARNRGIMWNAYYSREPEGVRRHFMTRWEDLYGEPYSARQTWIYEGWYDEQEEPPEEVEEYEERPEI